MKEELFSPCKKINNIYFICVLFLSYHLYNEFLCPICFHNLLCKYFPTPRLQSCLVKYNLSPRLSYATRFLVSQKGQTSREHTFPFFFQCTKFHITMLASDKHLLTNLLLALKARNNLPVFIPLLFKDNINDSSIFSCFFFPPGRFWKRERWMVFSPIPFCKILPHCHSLLQKSDGEGE